MNGTSALIFYTSVFMSTGRCKFSRSWGSEPMLRSNAQYVSNTQHLQHADKFKEAQGVSKFWQQALQKVEDSRVKEMVPKVSDYGNSITFCGKSAHWQKACEILCGYALRWLESNTISYNATISACEKGGIWLPSLCMLQELDWQGMEVSVITSSAAISSCRESNQWGRAMSLLDRTYDESLQPNTITYTASVSAYEKSSQWHLALHSLEHIQLKCIQGHIFALNSCIASCENAQKWDLALTFFHSLAWKVQRDVATYNATLSALGTGHFWQGSLQKLRDLSSSLDPSVITYNSAVSIFEKVSRWQHALLVFDELAQLASRRLQANVTTCNSLISAFEKCGAWREALHLVSCMIQVWRLRPDSITYNATISACEKASMWQLSSWLLFEDQLERDIVTCNSAATSCVKGFSWQNAIAIFQHCHFGHLLSGSRRPGQPVRPGKDAISCAVGIDAYGKVAAWQSGFCCMEQLLQSDVKLDLVACNRALSAFEDEISWQKSCGFLEDLLLQMNINAITCNTAIGVYIRGTQWNRVFNIITELEQRHLQPTLLTHNSAIQASTVHDQWQLALLSLKRLEQKVLPDILTYHFGMVAFQKGHRCLEAIHLMDRFQRATENLRLEKGLRGEDLVTTWSTWDWWSRSAVMNHDETLCISMYDVQLHSNWSFISPSSIIHDHGVVRTTSASFQDLMIFNSWMGHVQLKTHQTRPPSPGKLPKPIRELRHGGPLSGSWGARHVKS